MDAGFDHDAASRRAALRHAREALAHVRAWRGDSVRGRLRLGAGRAAETVDPNLDGNEIDDELLGALRTSDHRHILRLLARLSIVAPERHADYVRIVALRVDTDEVLAAAAASARLDGFDV